MADYKYLIVGGGMTAAAAVSGIREADRQGSIGLISAEPHPPYNRPPLSKALWKGKPLGEIWRKLEEHGVETYLEQEVISLDPVNKQVTVDRGDRHSYDKLLLATGGTPRKLPFGGDKILYFRTLADYYYLRELASHNPRFAIIGGGFIGSEIAAALRMVGQEVVIIFPEAGIGGRIFPADLSAFINDYYGEKGVDVRPGELLSGLESKGNSSILRTEGGKEIEADHIVAGIGIQPNTDLARAAGIETKDGIVVDDHLQTNLPDIYAAGDVANFYDPNLGERRRVEHEDNANTMGAVAGRNMAGMNVPYHYTPYSYSDLFDLGYEAVGILNPDLETVSDWQEQYQKGVVYYLRNGRVRGVLLWNVWGQVKAARALIAEPGPFKPEDLRGRLPAKA